MAELRPRSVQAAGNASQVCRERGLGQQRRESAEAVRRQKCQKRTGLILVFMLLGFIIYMLKLFVEELNRRAAREQAKKAVNEDRGQQCLAAPNGVSRTDCMNQAGMPRKGECVTGPALESTIPGQPEYLTFDYINKDLLWHVTRNRALDFWTLLVNGSQYRRCNCGFAQEDTCSFQLNLGIGEREVQSVETCDEDAKDGEWWGAAQVTTLQVKYGAAELTLLLAEYLQTWWCIDSVSKPTPCNLVLTQNRRSTTVNVLQTIGRVAGKVSQLSATQNNGRHIMVDSQSVCQLLRPKGFPTKKYDDFKDFVMPTIVVRETAEKLNLDRPSDVWSGDTR